MSMRTLLLFLITGCLLGACKQAPEPTSFDTPSEKETNSDTLLAQVGSLPITQQQLQERLNLLNEADFTFSQTNTGRRNFLQLLVREKLALLDAQHKQLDKSDEYLSALEDKRAQLNAVYQAFADQLLIHLWEDYLQTSGTIQITDKEIETCYKKYPYEMTLKQIIIEDAQTADTVLRELKHNKHRWKELERQYSSAPEYSKGKEITFMPGEFIAELEVIAANSATGSVQGFYNLP